MKALLCSSQALRTGVASEPTVLCPAVLRPGQLYGEQTAVILRDMRQGGRCDPGETKVLPKAAKHENRDDNPPK
jgi:hypothetical protein